MLRCWTVAVLDWAASLQCGHLSYHLSSRYETSLICRFLLMRPALAVCHLVQKSLNLSIHELMSTYPCI